MERETVYAIAKATGLGKSALLRFKAGRQSLRLDLADKLAAYFGIDAVKRKGK